MERQGGEGVARAGRRAAEAVGVRTGERLRARARGHRDRGGACRARRHLLRAVGPLRADPAA